MKVNVSVDLTDFMDYFEQHDIIEDIHAEMKAEVMKIVKKDARYKAYVNQKANELLENL